VSALCLRWPRYNVRVNVLSNKVEDPPPRRSRRLRGISIEATKRTPILHRLEGSFSGEYTQDNMFETNLATPSEGETPSSRIVTNEGTSSELENPLLEVDSSFTPPTCRLNLGIAEVENL